ncbi:ATP-binding protein [Roseateles koreensis]|uniref:Adenylate/guanylate cyclase domain-containing protein n=1 Tax=Roseateles koreensis TaxID=2987526 RepID=A0ABT5KRY1_9BURK|nr:adenylate/guanylate cyclase domain-containing protein [Roseateles koreensis]
MQSDFKPEAKASGQRRNLTLLFVDLSESTRLAEAMEAEDYALMLAELRQLYQSAVARQGGTVVRIQGDGMLAIFGHPQADEEDGRRAATAALELHEAVRSMRPPSGQPYWPHRQVLTLHSGIHAGMVLMEAGDEVRGRFELLGNVPNIAARLCDAAGPDEIVVSESSLGLHCHFFQVSERRALLVKGRGTPLSVVNILGRAAITRRFEASQQRGLAPFVGRGAELNLLEQALAAASHGRPRWISVQAGPGLGKTRLTEEFLQRAMDENCQIHRGYCESHLSAEPLQPYLQMLRTLQAMGCADVDKIMQLPPKSRADAVLAYFLSQAERQPQLLFIDDLHWADDASLALLHRLRGAALQARLPVFLLTASRPLEQGSMAAMPELLSTANAPLQEDVQVCELQPFNLQEARAATAQLLPRVDPFWALEIQRHAGGNPLFIEELCHALAHQGDDQDAARNFGAFVAKVTPAGATAASPLGSGSAWLSALVESRVARLLPEEAELLRIAAVIGNVIPSWLLHRLTGCDEDHPAVRSLAAQDFVFPAQRQGYLRFKHGIARDVVYESTGMQSRQALHHRILSELHERSQAGEEPAHELLAYHSRAARQWEAAARHAEQAGDLALAGSALDRAKQQYRAVLEALEHLPPSDDIALRWISIAQRFGMACVFDASVADLRVLQHAAKLAQMSGDRELIARAEYWMGYVSYALGQSRSGALHCENGLTASLHGVDEALTAQLSGALGQIRAAAADYASALELLDQAIAFQRPRQRPGRAPIGLAYSLACRAYVLGDQGDFKSAHEAFEEALSGILGSNHAVEASIQGWRAAVLLWQGRWAEAQVCGSEARRIGTQVRSLFTCAMGHAAQAYGAWKMTGSEAACDALINATHWLTPRGGGLFNSLNHGWLAEISAGRGEFAKARHHQAEALMRARSNDLIGVAMAHRAGARVAAQMGRAVHVKRYLDSAFRVAERRQSLHEQAVTWLCSAELAAVPGGASGAASGRDAQRDLDAAERAFERMGMSWHLGEVARLRQRG